MKIIEHKKAFNLSASGGLVQNPGIEFWGLLFLEGYNIEIGTMSIVENRERKWESGMWKGKSLEHRAECITQRQRIKF